MIIIADLNEIDTWENTQIHPAKNISYYKVEIINTISSSTLQKKMDSDRHI